MKSKKVLLIGMGFIIAFIVGITTWSPWLSDAEVEKIVRGRKNFIENHDNLGYPIEDIKVNIMRVPFGRWVTTVEGVWFVGFWNGF